MPCEAPVTITVLWISVSLFVSFLFLQGFWSNEKISTNRDLPSIHELDVWCDDDGITVFQSLPHFDSGFRS